MTKRMHWNADLYNDKHSFVYKYGEELVEALQPQQGEFIADLGCGTGYLTHLISKTGASVLGIDASEEMILKAKNAYPKIDFQTADITRFEVEHSLDALFSNATLHWVLQPQLAAAQMYKALKPGGRLLLEMGGKGNVQGIVEALENVLTKLGYANNIKLNPWYFPSLGTYSLLLEKEGFAIQWATSFKRDTLLEDTSNGIMDWLKMFGKNFFKDIPADVIGGICKEVQNELKPTHFRNGQWYADYQRLRLMAVK